MPQVFDVENDVTLRLVGGNLAIGTADVESWSTSPTIQYPNYWYDMFNFIFESRPPGIIQWVYIYLKYRVRATTATAVVIERVSARNKDYTWVTISNELSTANIGIAWITRTTSGFLLPITNFNRVPLEVAVQMQTNETDTARLEVSSESYIRCVYKV